MKAPSKNISRSLDGQRIPARSAPPIRTNRLGGTPTMTVPGEGNVPRAPGPVDERSAVHYADAMARQTGR